MVTSERIMPADSKYSSGMALLPAAPGSSASALYTMPAAAPSATSESIFGAPLKSREKPTVKYARLAIRIGTSSRICVPTKTEKRSWNTRGSGQPIMCPMER